jgi:serine/threonine-protein kinase
LSADRTVAGRYRLEEQLGQSGMSDVWRAHDLVLSRPVALKLLAPGSDRTRFEREAKALASLAHPNVGRLYDYGETEGRPYLVLEYLPGGTLEQRLSSGKALPDAQTRAIAAGMAAGLEHAHARGVVHRDLKPANVLFDEEGRAKLVDFGIAHSAHHDISITEPGTVLGTAAYMAPEQSSSARVGPPADVYAFGAILYRMLTGHAPFVAKDPLELIRLHRTADPPPISVFRTDAPPELASTAFAALAKDPAERPPDGAALMRLLAVAETATLAGAIPPDEGATLVMPRVAAPLPPAPAGPPPPGSRRRLWLIIGGVIALLVAGLAVAYAVSRSTGTPAQITTTPPTTTAPPTTTTPPTTQPTTTPPTTTAPPTTTTTPATTTTPPTTTAPPTTSATTTTTPTTTTAPTTTTEETTTAATTTGP